MARRACLSLERRHERAPRGFFAARRRSSPLPGCCPRCSWCCQAACRPPVAAPRRRRPWCLCPRPLHLRRCDRRRLCLARRPPLQRLAVPCRQRFRPPRTPPPARLCAARVRRLRLARPAFRCWIRAAATPPRASSTQPRQTSSAPSPSSPTSQGCGWRWRKYGCGRAFANRRAISRAVPRASSEMMPCWLRARQTCCVARVGRVPSGGAQLRS